MFGLLTKEPVQSTLGVITNIHGISQTGLFTTTPFTGRTLHGLLIQMQYIGSPSSGMRRKLNFVLGLKVTQQAVVRLVFIFTFRFLFSSLPPPPKFVFLDSYFFLLLGLTGFNFGRKMFLGKLLGS